MGSIKITSELKSKPQQATTLTLALREALSILEMPLPLFAEWLQEQIEQNPALQFDEQEPESEKNYRPSFYHDISSIDQIAASTPTLQDHLLQQARETLSSPEDLKKMGEIIGNLDERGFLDPTSTNPRLISLLQTFDPPGIGARNLQHSLLLQLKRRGEQKTIAYYLIHDHYEDLLYHPEKLPYTPTQIKNVLSHLSLNPAAPFQPLSLPPQIPDIFIELQDGEWILTPNTSLLPKFKINPELSRFTPSALWVEKMVSRRTTIMIAIVKHVLEVQTDFFLGKTSDLCPLSFKHIAQKLSLHPSTVSRAVKEKVVSSPRGIYPLRFFFPHTTSGETSHHTAKERLKMLIERENKQKPLSDESLTQALHAQGIPCARRTVTKYRKKLKIPAASQRKKEPR